MITSFHHNFNHALADAALGASVKVRISDGKIIQGTAVSQGVVEVVME